MKNSLLAYSLGTLLVLTQNAPAYDGAATNPPPSTQGIAVNTATKAALLVGAAVSGPTSPVAVAVVAAPPPNPNIQTPPREEPPLP